MPTATNEGVVMRVGRTAVTTMARRIGQVGLWQWEVDSGESKCKLRCGCVKVKV